MIRMLEHFSNTLWSRISDSCFEIIWIKEKQIGEQADKRKDKQRKGRQNGFKRKRNEYRTG